MNAVFVFAAALLLAVLIPERASRGVLSTAVLFLVTGFVMSQGMFGVVVLSPQDPAVAVLAELALFSVLFTDGMRPVPRNSPLPGDCRAEPCFSACRSP